MRFAVAGEFALNTAKTLQILKRQAVETVEGAQGIDAVFRMAGVVDKMKSLVPWASLRGKHNAVDRGHDFGKPGRAAPVAGGAAVDGVKIHQRYERAAGARIGKRDFRAAGISHPHRISGRGFGRGREFGGKFERRQRRRCDWFYDRGVSSHDLLIMLRN